MRGSYMRGSYLVDFLLVMMGFLAVVVPLMEFLRLSLIDQALARATHRAALAVQLNPADCESVIQAAFSNDGLAGWLLDANGDGTLAISIPTDRQTANGPLGNDEVLVVVDWDDPSDGVCWQSSSGCADTGCAAFTKDHEWLQLRARIGPGTWSGVQLWPDGFERVHRSWARFEI